MSDDQSQADFLRIARERGVEHEDDSRSVLVVEMSR
jgi:hypothetical protein